MSVTLRVNRSAMADLQRMLEANLAVDWRTIALDGQQSLTTLVWRELDPESLTPFLMGYQRLLRILPMSEDRRALPMFEDGLHSAIQIANLPRDEFVRRWSALFPGEDDLGLAVYRAALSRRSELLLHYVHDVQRNEPHYRAARFK